MINNKAINILAGMSKKEFVKFEKFLDSPYFNNKEKPVQLYRFLKKFYPAFNSPRFNKKSIHKYVYGKEKYTDEKLRKLFSDFYKLSEKYLVFLNLEKSKADYDKFLLDELDWRKIDNIFLSKYNERKNYLEQSDYHYQTFFHLYILKWQIVSFHLDRGE